MNRSLQNLTPEEELALTSALSGADKSELAASAAEKVLTNMALRSQALGLKPALVLSAFANASEPLSINGIYYRIQSFLLNYAGVLIATTVACAGIAALTTMAVRGGVALVDKIGSAIKAFAKTVAPGSNALLEAGASIFSWIFGSDKTTGDEVRDEETLVNDSSMFMLALGTAVPAPALFLINAFTTADANATPVTPPVRKTSPGTSAGTSGLMQSSVPLYTTAAPAAPAAPAASAPTWQSVGINAAGQVLGAVLNRGLDWIGLADEVRDDLDDDFAKFGTYLNQRYGIAPRDEVRDHSGTPENAR